MNKENNFKSKVSQLLFLLVATVLKSIWMEKSEKSGLRRQPSHTLGCRTQTWSPLAGRRSHCQFLVGTGSIYPVSVKDPAHLSCEFLPCPQPFNSSASAMALPLGPLPWALVSLLESPCLRRSWLRSWNRWKRKRNSCPP